MFPLSIKSSMLTELKFVQGAVSRKDLIPGMTHFAIEKGHVRAYNGVLALSSPIAFDIDCKPKAKPLVDAITKCGDATPLLTLTPKGRLKLSCGNFYAFVDLLNESTPHVLPEGDEVQINGEVLLAAFKILEKFVGSDQSRPWNTGVLLRGQSAFATNNVALVEYWLGVDIPRAVNVPSIAIEEILRIDEPPTHAQIGTHSITFHFSGERWVRSQLLDINWPDLAPILDKPSTAIPIDPELFEGIQKLRPFADKAGRIYFKEGVISTSPEHDEEGAAFRLENFPYDGIYQIDMLRLLDGTATHIDFTPFPRPCNFYGERLRGAIIGMRKI